MNGHSVPKNVTEFQFHLVGDMTLKQFLYLASGLAAAYVTFAAFAKPYPFIAWPLIIIFASLGAAFAFLPILDRPLDHWTKTYFKAIFSPTLRAWRSSIFNTDNPAFSDRLNLYLSSLPELAFSIQEQPEITLPGQLRPVSRTQPVYPPKPIETTKLISLIKPIEKTQPFMPLIKEVAKQQEVINPQPAKLVTSIEPPKITAIPPPVKPPVQAKKEEELPTEEELSKTVELAKQAQIIQTKIIETERILNEIKAKAAIPGAHTSDFTEKFQEQLENLQRLTNQASDISHKLALLSKTTHVLPHNKVEIKAETHISGEKELILTTIPNIINGIVIDSRGNFLEGVIVVTHDKQGLPVRALKTNKLGQFIAATPLANGIYTITLEKDELLFDILEIKLEGTIIPPIKISSKNSINIVQ